MRTAILVALSLALSPTAVAEKSTSESEALAEAERVATSLSERARTYEPAKTIERKAPRYPRSALSRGREAWIYVAYCIDESGKPQNISVLDATGSEHFERAAIDSVKQWRFEPALLNGKPSWQSRNQSYITFAIEDDNRGATRQFAIRYKKLAKLIEQDKLEEADALFAKTLADDKLNLYELGRLWGQRVRHELKTGDVLKLDLALRRATASNGRWIESETYHYLLHMRVRVQAQIGHYIAARGSYESLVKEVGGDSPLVTELNPIMEKVAAAIDSGSILQVRGEVREQGGCWGCNDSYQFTPVHRNLMLRDIDGTLNSIEMRCDHRHFQSEISELVEWNIPEDWGRCSVRVRGEPGTSFNILMIPDA